MAKANWTKRKTTKIRKAQAQTEKLKNGEPQKIEKTHQKITLPTFEKEECKKPNHGGVDSHST